MPVAKVTVSSPVPKSFRAAKIEGMFDVPHRSEQALTFTADLNETDEKPWSVGAIVGASGRGKSTLARALWPDEYVPGSYDWSADCLLDDFPDDLSPDQIVAALTSVGFSSPPAWLRPYRVLSNGQKHRADLARALTSGGDLVVMDEFTSVVDRTVAKSMSAAVAKYVRRVGRQFVAVTCHRDVLEWLEVDWFYDQDEERLHWGCKRRPPVKLEICEGSREAWRIFRGHHYLTGSLHKGSRVFLTYATFEGEPEALVGFFALLPMAGHRGWWRGHRTVVLPDYQGLGIGNRMVEEIAEQLWRRERKRFRTTTAAPARIAHMRRRPHMWRCTMAPKMKAAVGKTGIRGLKSSAGRLTATFVYVPEDLRRPSPTGSGSSRGTSVR